MIITWFSRKIFSNPAQKTASYTKFVENKRITSNLLRTYCTNSFAFIYTCFVIMKRIDINRIEYLTNADSTLLGINSQLVKKTFPSSSALLRSMHPLLHIRKEMWDYRSVKPDKSNGFTDIASFIVKVYNLAPNNNEPVSFVSETFNFFNPAEINTKGPKICEIDIIDKVIVAFESKSFLMKRHSNFNDSLDCWRSQRDSSIDFNYNIMDAII